MLIKMGTGKLLTTSGRIGMKKKPMSAETAEMGEETGAKRQNLEMMYTVVSTVAILEFPASLRMLQLLRLLLPVFAQF